MLDDSSWDTWSGRLWCCQASWSSPAQAPWSAMLSEMDLAATAQRIVALETCPHKRDRSSQRAQHGYRGAQGGWAGTIIIVKRKVATTLRSAVSPACCQPRACGTRTRSARLEGTMIKAPTCVMAIASGHVLSAGSLFDPATTSKNIAPGSPSVSMPMPKTRPLAREARLIHDHHCSDMLDPLNA